MFLELYKSKDKAYHEKNAQEYLVDILLQKKLKGDDKTTTLTALRMEETLKEITPSMFYTFQYNAKDPVVLGKTSFVDCVPLILCTSVDKKTVCGINFNMLPNDVRASVLDIIYKAFESFYKDDVYGQKPGEVKLNSKFMGMLVNKLSLKNFLNVLKDKTGVDISKAYRQYNISGMSNVRLVEYDQWRHIPFLSFKDAVRGASLANIQAEVVSKK